jgi:hypothetical protein
MRGGLPRGMCLVGIVAGCKTEASGWERGLNMCMCIFLDDGAFSVGTRLHSKGARDRKDTNEARYFFAFKSSYVTLYTGLCGHEISMPCRQDTGFRFVFSSQK